MRQTQETEGPTHSVYLFDLKCRRCGEMFSSENEEAPCPHCRKSSKKKLPRPAVPET